MAARNKAVTGVRQHPRHGLDELIHSPVRLSLMATLATAGETDFRFLRDALEISDSLLSKHAAQLEAAGYVHVVKGFVGKRPSTWFSLTEDGRAAFDRYRRTLAEILESGAAGSGAPGPRAAGSGAGAPGPSGLGPRSPAAPPPDQARAASGDRRSASAGETAGSWMVNRPSEA